MSNWGACCDVLLIGATDNALVVHLPLLINPGGENGAVVVINGLLLMICWCTGTDGCLIEH